MGRREGNGGNKREGRQGRTRKERDMGEGEVEVEKAKENVSRLCRRGEYWLKQA